MPLSPALARWLIDEGHNAVHASDIGMAKAADAEILSRARQEARTVITADLDYSRLLALARVGVPSLILFRGGNWNEIDIIARMRELLQGLSETDIEQSILIVDRQRVRRRRLPLLS
jgi:predicted nuclease of predicted toxin-antitoxin system